MAENRQHPIGELMSATLQKIRELVDVNTIVGQPIQTGEVTIIPVSKVSFGFASGGGDYASKDQKPEADNFFGGGSGAGVNIVPIAFMVITGNNVRLMPVSPPAGGPIDRVVEMVPDLLERAGEFFGKNRDTEEDF